MNTKTLCINTVRTLSTDGVEKAKSGHPGLPMGAAPMAFTLWDDVLKISPAKPDWIDRDRFILSAGHASMLNYSLLHLFGYDVSIEDLKQFRQLGSKTPGHPEYGHTPGLEATTGPLGQGLSMAVGMAMAEAHLAATFNTDKHKIIDHYTYTIVGDGCLMEGQTQEASSLAGTLKLDKLIVLYDSNDITIEGSTDIAFSENVRARYESMGWDTFFVEDGNDYVAILKAIEAAKKTDKPSFIEIKTKIGYASPKENKASAHGEPLGAENLAIFKKNINWPSEEPFFVPEEVRSYMAETIAKKNKAAEEWEARFKAYKKDEPELYKALMDRLEGRIDESIFEDPEIVAFDKSMASRASSGIVLNRLAARVPQLFGGSADLGPSNKSVMSDFDYFTAENRKGRNVHFGVREHAMAAICNGISLHGGFIAYGATFLVFSDYIKPALRLSSLMNQGVIFILTHDSIGVGEDGPTHEPIEQLNLIRALPNAAVYRPCDAKEAAYAWLAALKRRDRPCGFALSRQDLPNLEETGAGALKGGYVLRDFIEGKELDMILMATGSEVQLAYEVAKRLADEGVATRVVSMPCLDDFDEQSKEYRDSVLPPQVRKRVSIEALSTVGWHKYVGLDGLAIGMEGFGLSAPAAKLFEHFGFTPDKVYDKVKKHFNL